MTEQVKKALKYKFKDESLLMLAFTHKSYAVDKGCQSNEQLEHIGDALIGFLVTDILAELFPSASTGELTDRKQKAVTNKNKNILDFITGNGLDGLLLIGKTAANSGGVTDNMRADLFEALFGAAYRDGCRPSSIKKKLKKILKLGGDAK